MINPNAPQTELLGFLRADLAFLAQCLEGQHGEGRVNEAAPRAAEFIRAALAARSATLVTGPMPRLLERVSTDNDLEAAQRAFVLTESEARMIEKQRAHAARNASNEEDGNGGLPPV